MWVVLGGSVTNRYQWRLFLLGLRGGWGSVELETNAHGREKFGIPVFPCYTVRILYVDNLRAQVFCATTVGLMLQMLYFSSLCCRRSRPEPVQTTGRASCGSNLAGSLLGCNSNHRLLPVLLAVKRESNDIDWFTCCFLLGNRRGTSSRCCLGVAASVSLHFPPDHCCSSCTSRRLERPSLPGTCNRPLRTNGTVCFVCLP